MALQDYANVSVLYNGNPLEEVTSCEMTTNSGQQRIDTLSKGLSGFTPGAGDVTISIGYAIPIGGPEDNFQQNCAVGAYATLQIGVGPANYVGTGKIMSVSESQSVGASMEGTFEWVGELKARE
jgi:hypothetical protein